MSRRYKPKYTVGDIIRMLPNDDWLQCDLLIVEACFDVTQYIYGCKIIKAHEPAAKRLVKQLTEYIESEELDKYSKLLSKADPKTIKVLYEN